MGPQYDCGHVGEEILCAFHEWAGNSRGINARQMTRSIPFMDRSPSSEPTQDERLYTS